jgi:hypothetical protein
MLEATTDARKRKTSRTEWDDSDDSGRHSHDERLSRYAKRVRKSAKVIAATSDLHAQTRSHAPTQPHTRARPVRACVNVRACARTNARTRTHAYTRARARARTLTQSHSRMHAHTHARAHARTHSRTHARGLNRTRVGPPRPPPPPPPLQLSVSPSPAAPSYLYALGTGNEGSCAIDRRPRRPCLRTRHRSSSPNLRVGRPAGGRPERHSRGLAADRASNRPSLHRLDAAAEADAHLCEFRSTHRIHLRLPGH